MHQERRLANIVSPLISLPLSFSQRESMSRAPHKAFQTVIVKLQTSLITCIMYTCNPSPILHTSPLASKSEAPEIHQKNESPIAYGLLIAGPLAILLRRVEKGGSLDHRRSAQEDRNECTRDVLAGGQSLSSAGGWHDGRSSSSGRSSGLGARSA